MSKGKQPTTWQDWRVLLARLADIADKLYPLDRDLALDLSYIRDDLAAHVASKNGQDLDGGALVGNDRQGGGSLPTKAGGPGRGGWVELRMVNGCGPYAYQRWWEGDRKRTRYLGKVKK